VGLLVPQKLVEVVGLREAAHESRDSQRPGFAGSRPEPSARGLRRAAETA
jgi:hypothetical protein